MRGYFEIGIFHGKSPQNLGTLWRSAYQLGAAGIFTIGQRYDRQGSDTYKAYRHIPLRKYTDFAALKDALPFDCQLVAVEMGGKPLKEFHHPERAVYLLGAEDHGLPVEVVKQCHRLVSLEAIHNPSFNVAVTGSIVMYDRFARL